MDLWPQSMDELGALSQTEGLTVDQRIALLQIQATLSVSQKLSAVWDVLQRAEHQGWGTKPEPGKRG